MDNGMRQLNEWMWGYRAARALMSCAALGCSRGWPRGAMPADDRPRPAGRMRRCWTSCWSRAAMGLLDKDGDRYRTSALGDAYRRRPPAVSGAYHCPLGVVWVCGAITKDSGPAGTVQRWATKRNFILGMHDITMSGRGSCFWRRGPDGRQSLVDVGGGPGTYSILSCQRYPQLRATVFDVPRRCHHTQDDRSHGQSSGSAKCEGLGDGRFGRGMMWRCYRMSCTAR